MNFHEGFAVVQYWRERLAKDERYDPSCDHVKGVAVVAYIDHLIGAVADERAETDRIREAMAFQRDLHARMEAERNDWRRRAHDLDQALSDAEHRLTWGHH